MSFELDVPRMRAFVSTARARLLIDDDQAATLIDRAIDQQAPVHQLAIDTGILTAVQVEMVDAFLDPDDLAPGYRLLDVLGVGALGVVYRARQERLQRDVAIKAILQAKISQSNVLQRFQKEAAAIGRLQHPNIVAAYDSGAHHGRVFLVMELVAGSDLRERIEAGPLVAGAVTFDRPPNRAGTCTRPIAPDHSPRHQAGEPDVDRSADGIRFARRRAAGQDRRLWAGPFQPAGRHRRRRRSDSVDDDGHGARHADVLCAGTIDGRSGRPPLRHLRAGGDLVFNADRARAVRNRRSCTNWSRRRSPANLRDWTCCPRTCPSRSSDC